MSTKTVTHPDATSWSARLARQATRRALVWAWALCCLAFLALGMFEIKGVVWFILIALTVAADFTLYLATHRVTDRPTSALDEREQVVRNRAYRSAYLVVFYGIVVVVGGALLLLFTGQEIASPWFSHPARHYVVLTGFGIAALQLVSLLPTAIVAWTERDEPGERD